MEIKLGNVLEGACAMAGYDLSLQTAPARWRQMAAMAVNEGLRRIHAEKFPALRRTEFRRYRPPWSAASLWRTDQECWCAEEGAYFRLESGAGTTSPAEQNSGWRRLKMCEVVPFVAFDQPWEATEIDPAGVVLEDFAFEVDPKYNPCAAAAKGCGWFADGVLLPAPAPPGVFVRFTPKAPRVSFVEWSDERAWSRGEGCYVSDDRECYVALADVEADDDPPDESDSWACVRVRDEFEAYLTELAAANLMSEDQGRFQAKSAAEREFEDLQARFAEGAGDSSMRPGRFRR